jgi:hypothetical protein
MSDAKQCASEGWFDLQRGFHIVIFTKVYKFSKKSPNLHCIFRIFSSFNDDVSDSNDITPNDRAKVNNELAGVWKEMVLPSL